MWGCPKIKESLPILFALCDVLKNAASAPHGLYLSLSGLEDEEELNPPTYLPTPTPTSDNVRLSSDRQSDTESSVTTLVDISPLPTSHAKGPSVQTTTTTLVPPISWTFTAPSPAQKPPALLPDKPQNATKLKPTELIRPTDAPTLPPRESAKPRIVPPVPPRKVPSYKEPTPPHPPPNATTIPTASCPPSGPPSGLFQSDSEIEDADRVIEKLPQAPMDTPDINIPRRHFYFFWTFWRLKGFKFYLLKLLN